MAISLKAARVNKKLTQLEAAEQIGVSEQALRNWERGKTFPTVPFIRKLEEVYGVSYADIIFLPDDTV
jgi:transcriptional regulator with XRE-family HTH domain